eukprot:Gregarina_sp_Poly_1__9810@NODE_628_length_7065_cov_56_119891_g481_i0_p1_GENE_NODE_628_length_7065_cov_56_119891_g481_i0NODE_628_length_7065_cov_56_119891_g481_i0_p1_ORF_typecomplete_len612_score76_91Tubulin/PF00091_25/6e36Tubulin/PF00091_25/7_4e02Tubulin_C/PF03953_17/8_7e03Tubulin_C/PF03953_17/4_2e07Tubulin_2/PF13809_6/0_16_NODE_628_length_7065_cov_56_119891_g481_i026524487
MREIVSIHIGQNGCGLGRAIWKLLCHEHDIGPEGVAVTGSNTPNLPRDSMKPDDDPLTAEANLEPFFLEKDWRYTPRALFFDSDPSAAFAFDDTTAFNSLFQPQNLVFGGKTCTQNILPLAVEGFAAHWKSAPPHGFKFLLRKELERCNYPTTFLVTNSICGGTGAGVGSFLMSQLRDMAPKMTLVNLCHFPSSHGSLTTNSMLSVFNSCLSIPKIADTSQMSLVFDNEALFDAALNHLQIQEASFTLLNDMTASLYGSMTCPIRFPYSKRINGLGSRETLTYSTLDLGAFARNLVPVACLPFIVGGFSPLTSIRENISLEKEIPSYSLRHLPTSKGPEPLHAEGWRVRQRVLEVRDQRECMPGTLKRKLGLSRRQPSVRELCWSLFSPENMFCTVDPYRGRFMKSMVVFRGKDVTRDEVIRQTIAIEHHGVQDMTDMWMLRMPRRIHCHAFKVPERQLIMSAAFFGLLTSMSDRLMELNIMYSQLLRRNAFVHRYITAGLERTDLDDARDRITEMAKQYQGLEQLLALRQIAEEGTEVSQRDLSEIHTDKALSSELQKEEEAFLMRTKIKFIWPNLCNLRNSICQLTLDLRKRKISRFRLVSIVVSPAGT